MDGVVFISKGSSKSHNFYHYERKNRAMNRAMQTYRWAKSEKKESTTSQVRDDGSEEREKEKVKERGINLNLNIEKEMQMITQRNKFRVGYRWAKN